MFNLVSFGTGGDGRANRWAILRYAVPRLRFTLRGLLAAVVVLAVIFSIVRGVAVRHFGATQLDALLSGSKDIELARLTTDYQQRRVVCTDRAVLEYFASSLRHAKLDRFDSGSGITYQFTFHFSGASQTTVLAYVDTDRFSLAVPSFDPVEGAWATHDVSLPQPLPDRVRDLIDFLNAPWERVAGLVLLAEDEAPLRYEYDASLHMRNPRGTDVPRLTSVNRE